MTDVYEVIYFFFFFFNDPAPTEIYTLSLHDALPICHADPHARHGWHPNPAGPAGGGPEDGPGQARRRREEADRRGGTREGQDRKSTRLNSSHANISYAVFCLKKKNNYTSSLAYNLVP